MSKLSLVTRIPKIVATVLYGTVLFKWTKTKIVFDYIEIIFSVDDGDENLAFISIVAKVLTKIDLFCRWNKILQKNVTKIATCFSLQYVISSQNYFLMALTLMFQWYFCIYMLQLGVI